MSNKLIGKIEIDGLKGLLLYFREHNIKPAQALKLMAFTSLTLISAIDSIEAEVWEK